MWLQGKPHPCHSLAQGLFLLQLLWRTNAGYGALVPIATCAFRSWRHGIRRRQCPSRTYRHPASSCRMRRSLCGERPLCQDLPTPRYRLGNSPWPPPRLQIGRRLAPVRRASSCRLRRRACRLRPLAKGILCGGLRLLCGSHACRECDRGAQQQGWKEHFHEPVLTWKITLYGIVNAHGASRQAPRSVACGNLCRRCLPGGLGRLSYINLAAAPAAMLFTWCAAAETAYCTSYVR